MIEMLIFQLWGTPLHCTLSLYIYNIHTNLLFSLLKSLCTNFFFQTFLVHEFFFLFVFPARILFLFPPPHHFSNGPPLKIESRSVLFKGAALFKKIDLKCDAQSSKYGILLRHSANVVLHKCVISLLERSEKLLPASTSCHQYKYSKLSEKFRNNFFTNIIQYIQQN